MLRPNRKATRSINCKCLLFQVTNREIGAGGADDREEEEAAGAVMVCSSALLCTLLTAFD